MLVKREYPNGGHDIENGVKRPITKRSKRGKFSTNSVKYGSKAGGGGGYDLRKQKKGALPQGVHSKPCGGVVLPFKNHRLSSTKNKNRGRKRENLKTWKVIGITKMLTRGQI